MSEPFDLQPLVTQCPNCHTQFRVSEAQLQIANGKVRCGACLSVFQGVDNIIWEQDVQLGDDADNALDDLLDELETEPDANEVDEFEAPVDAESILGLGSAPTPTPTPTPTEADLAPEHNPVESQPLSTEDAAEALAAAVAATFSQPAKSDLPTAAGEPPVAAEPEPEQPTVSVPAASESVEIATQPPAEPSVQQPSMPETAAEPEPETELEAEAAALAQQQANPELELEPLPEAKLEMAANADPVPTPKPAAAVQSASAQHQEPAKPAPSAAPPKSVQPPEALPADPVEEAPDPFERLSANKSDELPTPGAERGWMLYAVTIGGVVLLLGQILIFRFDVWTQDPGLRPIYATLCPVFGCELPPLQALDQMSSRNLTVRTHPSVEGALMVDTVIINAADFPQAFPVLELTFTDIDGNVVAGRRFEPAEYLAGELKDARNIASRTPVRIKLEIQDPGPKAVSYKMDFR